MGTEPPIKQNAFDLVSLKKSKPLPSYTVLTLFPKIKDLFIYNRTLPVLFTLLYGAILEQPNLPAEILEEELKWIDINYSVVDSSSMTGKGFVQTMGFKQNIISNPSVSVETLKKLCYSPNWFIRHWATTNSRCPKEGQIVATLLNSSVGEFAYA